MSKVEPIKTYPMLINGRQVETDATFEVDNPATGEVIAHVTEMAEATVAEVLQSAQAGFKVWSKMSHAQRKPIILKYAELLEANQEEIIQLLIAETGKPRDNAEYDFGMLTTCLRFFIEEAERLDQPVLHDHDDRFLHYVLRQPLGVTLGFLAWNFPLLNFAYKIGPMLAAGCSGIMKPSAQSPLATLAAAYLAKEAGIPDGVVNVVTGTDHDLAGLLGQSEIPDLVTMIGSTNAGLQVMKNSLTSIKHFSVELGGNAPVVVYPDADIKSAAEKTVGLKFVNCGQVCVSPNRCFVHESVYDAFLEYAQAAAAEATVGPLMTQRALEGVLKLVADAEAQGAKVLIGGQAVDGPGNFMQPTILTDVTSDMNIVRNEIFGPVLPIIRYTDADDVIAMANDTIHGLSAYVFTSNIATGLKAAKEIDAGSVCVNEPVYSVQLPHGGVKQSGIGKDCSRYSLQEYLTVKRVSVLID